MNRKNYLLLALVFLFAQALSGCKVAEAIIEPPLPEIESIEKLVNEKLPAYIFIGGGSGAVISPDGLMITNVHVAGDSAKWQIRTGDGKVYTANVVGSAPGTDLCLLQLEKAPKDMVHFTLADSDLMKPGDVVFSMGNPFALGGLDGKATINLGVISALGVHRPNAYDAIQTDCPINPGNSGGPLINLKGELVGINSQIQPRYNMKINSGVGYAISANQLKRYLPALKAANGGEIRFGKFGGVEFGELADEAAIIKKLTDDAPAVKAGLKVGDQIKAVNGAEVKTLIELIGLVGRHPAGTELTLKIERKVEKAEPQVFDVKLMINTIGEVIVGVKFVAAPPLSLQVEEVIPNSPAAKAGIQKGDYITGIGNARLMNRMGYNNIMRQFRGGMTVPFMISRNGQPIMMQIQLEETKGY